MTPDPHRLVLASAGTGKTFQLTGHFLRLLFAGVPPERVLATTFTRKAAGEILDRVLRRLVDAAERPEKREALRGELDLPELDAARCVALLAELARRLDRFQVRTLDSFFVHLARLFALELLLPPDWRIAGAREAEEVAADAVAKVLEDASAAERLELLRGLRRDAAARAVHPALLAIVSDFRSVGLETTPDAWRFVVPEEAPDEDALARAKEHVECFAVPLTAKGAPFKSWERSKREALERIARGDWAGLLGVGLVKKVAAGLATFDKKPIADELRDALALLVRRAAFELVGAVARQNAAVHAFLERYEAARRALQRERATIGFDDLAPLLLDGAFGSSAAQQAVDEDLWYRLDGRLDHLLLDEFQDTAPLQWRVLEQVAGEVLADGTGERSFFCVGDVKQSIYGWRRAEPRLLAQLGARHPVLCCETMSKSWRSSRVVLDAVDRCFRAIDASPVFDGDEHAPLREAAARWRASFAQPAAGRELPGAAVMYQAPAHAEGERKQLPALRLAVERVAALVGEAPGATVGVLLRRNADIPLLLARLLQRGIRASGEGGNPLTDSDAVLVFLSLLHLADHSGDRAAAFHVAASPFGAHLGLAAEEHRARGPVLSRALRERLALEGFGAFAASLLPVVAAARERWSDWDLRRFERLVEMAHAYDARPGLRPIDFADHVRAERVDEPSSASVRVMTVHASKGLEFDAVVLPELDELVFQRGDRLLVRRDDPFGPIDAVSVAPPKEVCAVDPRLGALRDEARRRGLEEALSLLYVAMTRAARRLEWIVRHREPGKASSSLTYAAILRAALETGEPDGEGVLWRHPESGAWAAGLERRETALAPADPPIRLAPSRAPRSSRSRSASAEEARGGVDALLRPRASAGARRGTLVHRWLQELEWIETFALEDEALLALGAAIEPALDARRAALAELRAALARPSLREALSRTARTASGLELEVLRERRFAVHLPSDDTGEELWAGSIDRLVIERRAGEVVGAELLDYKTDRVDGAELERRIEVYRPQLAAYRRVAACIVGVEPAAIRARLAFLHVGRVVVI